MGSRLEKNSNEVRKRIAEHTFDGEDGEEYSASRFGGFSDYMRRKKVKLQNLDVVTRSVSEKPTIFRNVVAQVNGHTTPSLHDLHQMVVEYGGGFLQYLDGKTNVTHIIASKLTPKKKVEFAKYRIVRPEWVVDSIAAGRLLPWADYRLLEEGAGQKVLAFSNGQIVSQITQSQQGYRDLSGTDYYTLQMREVAERIEAQGRPNKYATSKRVERQGKELIATEHADFKSQVHEGTLLLPVSAGDNDDLAAEISDDLAEELVRQVEDVEKQAKRELTAEEHNAILLQNPHMAKSSTANPDFINQYYRESRLHHLSTWKAELKARLQARALASSQERGKTKRPTGSRRYILHVDFDSFFAAVSLRKNPQLVDKPVVVAHGNGQGSEIASCNYPARKYGVKNGMWMKVALELCPDLQVLPYDYIAYEEASKHFYDSILEVSGIVQSISIDEALIDISDMCIDAGDSDFKDVPEDSIYCEQEKASETALHLRETVKAKTGCDVSVGIGGNVLLAKVALRKAKPAGQHLIKPEDVLDFIGELLVVDLPGVAHSIGGKLEVIGVKYVKDIRALTKEKLIRTLGPKTGEKLWDYSRGIDRQEVGEMADRKSVSAEVNWGIRFTDQQEAETFILNLCGELSKRLCEQLSKGRQLTLKIMRKAADAGMDPPKNLGHGKCDTFNKSIVLGVATNDKALLGKEAVAILRNYNFPPGELRGIGVQMQKLEPIKQSNEGFAAESSQRRLQFKKPHPVDVSPVTKSPAPTTVFKKQSNLSNPLSKSSPLTASRSKRIADPIDEVIISEDSNLISPKQKPSLLEDTTYAPLNVSGTQFILPSQVDPDVLAALPADIRRRLAPQVSRAPAQKLKKIRSNSNTSLRSNSPFDIERDMQSMRQADNDFDLLSELSQDSEERTPAQDIKSAVSPKRKKQQLLPQSPRKKASHISCIPRTSPQKKEKHMDLLDESESEDGSLADVIAQPEFQSLSDYFDEDTDQALTDEEFESEMVEEVWQDSDDEHHEVDVDAPPMSLPERPPLPTFTSKHLSTMQELRDAMSSWVQTCSTQSDIDPSIEDARLLARYLQRVIGIEGDISKVQGVVDWLIYLVEDWPFEKSSLRQAWQEIISHLKEQVSDAMVLRGLPPLLFRE